MVESGFSHRFLNQSEFSEFLKDNRRLIVHPDGATMLEIAMTLEATTQSRVKGSVRTNAGTHIEYKEDIDAKAGKDGKIVIPDSIMFRVPIFLGMPDADIDADFKFRKMEGQIFFAYRMLSIEAGIRNVVKNSTEYIKGKTEIPVFNGEYIPR